MALGTLWVISLLSPATYCSSTLRRSCIQFQHLHGLPFGVLYRVGAAYLEPFSDFLVDPIDPLYTLLESRDRLLRLQMALPRENGGQSMFA